MISIIEEWVDSFDRVFDQWAGFTSPSPKSKAPSQASSRESTRNRTFSSIIKSLLGLDSWTFYVGAYGDWTGAQIQDLLERHGIRLVGWKDVLNGDIFFSVKLNQAEWAEYVMLEAGVPLKYGLYSARNRRHFPEAVERMSVSS